MVSFFEGGLVLVSAEAIHPQRLVIGPSPTTKLFKISVSQAIVIVGKCFGIAFDDVIDD
jgi:hypothetical protein